MMPISVAHAEKSAPPLLSPCEQRRSKQKSHAC
jgi:hypothetical protein